MLRFKSSSPILDAALEQYYSEYVATHRGNEPSYAKLEAFARKWTDQYNAKGLDVFDGLSPDDMDALLHKPFTQACAIQINDVDEALLADIPFFKGIFCVLEKLSREGKIKLTATGAFQCKFVNELATLTFPMYAAHKKMTTKIQYKQSDIVSVDLCNSLLVLSGIVQVDKSWMTLTPKGKEILSTRGKLFKEIVICFVTKVNLASYDRYPGTYEDINEVMYPLYLVAKYGDEPRKPKFYSDKYYRAFPIFRKETLEQRKDLIVFSTICFIHRMITNFLSLLGLVDEGFTVCDPFDVDDEIKIEIEPGCGVECSTQKTPLFDLAFTLKK